jgi:fucose permease
VKRIYASFVFTGVANTMLGPLMPGFEARWHLDDAQAGLLFAALFAASVCLASMAAFIARRIGYRRMIVLGMALMGAGILGCMTGSWHLALVSIAVVGCGLGMAVPATNLEIAANAPGASARALVSVNLAWSIGAVAAPLLIAQLGAAFPLVVGSGMILMALVLLPGGAGHRPVRVEHAKSSRRPSHLAFATMLFLYVGCEVSITGWISSYASRGATTGQLWAILPSVFWFAMLLGRIASPPVLRRVSADALAPAGLACGFAGAILLVAGSGPQAMLAASALAGFGFAPVFPIVVAQYADRAAGSVSGLVFASASLGGAAIPSLIGWLSTITGSLRAGLSSVFVFLAVLIWMQLRIPKPEPRIPNP